MLERCYYRACLQEMRQTISKELQTSVASEYLQQSFGKVLLGFSLPSFLFLFSPETSTNLSVEVQFNQTC